ncbi:Uncharacterized protein TPAR_01610 [Tolypocladium paradoxum]|uniref:ABM domain-containing protein n=1 Tax=Tolypocladium paradoxum TaxID=94208 RepID=A0A2S4L704_9HYPO|nr:Uncharacterized protein TPAR_01610 [Tolypocladium paradoxum]
MTFYNVGLLSNTLTARIPHPQSGANLKSIEPFKSFGTFKMTSPKFYVVARVVSRPGAMKFWRERLVHLCGISATERYGDSYYWGQDLDGEPDNLWGLEGYTHPVGFFLDHVSSDIFKREMALVDKDELLKTQQGIGSPDYDLHHYDEESGWLKRNDDPDKDSKNSHVAIYYFYVADESKRPELLAQLSKFAENVRKSQGRTGSIQSCLVLKELRDSKMATLWLRINNEENFRSLQTSGPLASLLASLKPIVSNSEVHQSRSFIGHLGTSATEKR